MIYARYITAVFALALTQIASAQSPLCDKGQQKYEGVCLSQRMVEYLVCVRNTGANKQKISDIVQQNTKEKKGGELAGKGSGIVLSGQGNVKGFTESENSIVRSLETTFFPGATSQCAAVLNSAPPEPPKKVSFSISESSFPKFVLRNTGGPSYNADVEFAEIATVASTKAGVSSPAPDFSFNGVLPQFQSDSATSINLNVTASNLQRMASFAQRIGEKYMGSGVGGFVLYRCVVRIKYDDDAGSTHTRAWQAVIKSNPSSSTYLTDGFEPVASSEFEEVKGLVASARRNSRTVSAGNGDEVTASRIECVLRALHEDRQPKCG